MSQASPPVRDGGDATSRGSRRRPPLWVVIPLVLVLLVVAAIAGLLLALRSPSLATRLANAALAKIHPLPRSALRAGEMRGDGVHFVLRDVRLARGDTLLAGVDTLRLVLRLPSLATGEIGVRDLELDGLTLTADLSDTNKTKPPPPQKTALTLPDLLRGRFYGGPAIRLDRLAIRGRAIGHFGAPDSGWVLSRITVLARNLRLGRGFGFDLDTVDVLGRPPRDGRIALQLAARLEDGRLDARTIRLRSDSSRVDASARLALGRGDSIAETRLALEARPFALRDLGLVAPGLAARGSVTAHVDVRGTRGDRASGTVTLASDRVRFAGIEAEALRLDAAMFDGRADTRIAALWAGARTSLAGWVRPLDPTPAYDLDVRLDRLPRTLVGLAWWPAMARRADASLALRVQGTEFAPPVANLTGHLSGAIGRIDLDGRIDMTRGLAWDVRRIAFAGVNVARVLGDTVASALNGTLSTIGANAADVRSRRMTAELQIGPSHYGAWHVTRARLRGRVHGEDMGASLGFASDGGTVEIDSLSGRWGETGTIRLDGASFSDLDLGRILRAPALASRLAGRIRGTARGLGARAGAMAALRDGRGSASLEIDLAPSRFRDQEIRSASLRLSAARGLVNAGGQVETADGHVDLAARARPLDATPSFDLDRLDFADLNLGAWTGSSTLVTRLTGSLSGGGRLGKPGVSAARWEGALRLDRSTIGRTELEGGAARGSWSGGRGSVSATIRSRRDTLAAAANVSMPDSIPVVAADLSIPFGFIAAVTGRDTLESRGKLVAHASFTGLDPATTTAEGLLTGKGGIGRARLDSLAARLRLRRGTLTLDTLFTRSNVGAFRGSGHVALRDTMASTDLHLAGVLLDAAPLRAVLGVDTIAIDTSTFDLRLRGAGARRTFALRSSVRSLAWQSVRLLGAEVSADGDLDAAWHPARVHAVSQLRYLRGVGVPVQQADARLDYDGREMAFGLSAAHDDRNQLHLAGLLSGDSLERHVRIDSLTLASDSASWVLVRPSRIDLGRTRFAIENFELRSRDGRLFAHGVIDRRGVQDFRLEMTNFGIKALTAWLGRSDVSGHSSARFAIQGPAAAPRGSGELRLDLRVHGEDAGTLNSRLAWDGTHLEVAGAFAAPKGDSLTATAVLPLAISLAPPESASASPKMKVVEGEVDVRLAANAFPLHAFSPLLDPSAVGPLEGTLGLDVRLRGRSHATTGEGRIDVSGGVVPLPPLGVTYHGLEMHGQFENDRLVLRQAHVISDKGTLDITGQVQWAAIDRIEPTLHVESRRFAFANTNDLRAIASGSVDVTGTVVAPVVKGKATIEHSAYTLVPITTAEPGSEVRLTPADLRMLEQHFGDVNVTPSANPATALYDASDLDLAISLSRDNWVRQRANPKMSVALTGDFRLKKAPHADPQMTGRIAPVPNRGFVEEFARSFDIASGEILLNGSMNQHHVDIQAQYKPPTSSESGENQTVITLEIEGRIDQMKLTLSSDPPMSEVEIVNYIATGKSAADRSRTSSGEDSGALARDIGLATISGGAEQAAQQAIGLDVLQVRFDPLLGATLVAGRYVDPELYVGFRQPLQYKQSGTATTSDVASTSVEVEYAIHQWLVVNLQAETSKVRSFIRARHAY